MLREKIGSRLAEISNIHCLVSPSSAKRINTNYPHDVEAAKFSAAYVIAYSLVHGIPKIKAFTPEALKDARTRRWRSSSPPAPIRSSATPSARAPRS